ncbi:MAG TPA: phosphotransferase [Acidimicrobiia bacterium]|nr:phosphotransferase [Acidimicrobiia bacterium]
MDPRLALQCALEPGRVTHELGARWDRFEWAGSDLVAAEVARVHERGDAYYLELDLYLTSTNGSGPTRVLGEFVQGDVEDRLNSLRKELRREAKSSLEFGDRGLAAVAPLQLLVRRPGLDRHLPVLDLLHRPETAAGVLSPHLRAGKATIELIEHRLEERAVLRACAGGDRLIVKGYDIRSELPERIVSVAASLRKRARPGVTVPTPLGLLASHRAVVWSKVDGTENSPWTSVGDLDDFEAVGRALRWLHDVPYNNLPIHDVAAEMVTLARSQRLLEAGWPDLAALVSSTMVYLAAGLVALGSRPLATVHGDAHPGQFIVNKDGAAILGLESVSVGEPAIDLGNYGAYLKIAGILDGDAHLHVGYQSHQDLIDRACTWRDAALFRLGVRLALTTDRAELGRRILTELTEG